MQETPQQYIARMLAFSAGKDPLAILSGTAGRLRALVESVPPEQWRRRPQPGRWSPGEVLAHLADVEIVIGWRMRSILARYGVPLQAFDQDVWAAAFRYQDVEPREALETFSAARASLLSLLRRVQPGRLAHHGMHAERGRETVQHLLRLNAGHDLNHVTQIEQMLEAQAGS
ncbi:MAG TPA: DinB family protein [Methylomirabilota bacterium]